jgi:hypothetical protein
MADWRAHYRLRLAAACRKAPAGITVPTEKESITIAANNFFRIAEPVNT